MGGSLTGSIVQHYANDAAALDEVCEHDHLPKFLEGCQEALEMFITVVRTLMFVS